MNAEKKASNRTISAQKDQLLKNAVHDHKATTIRGFLERLFTFIFRGFVYSQTWEDPEVDLNALELDENSRVMMIASGGCNVMNYLTEQPARVKAIDLNHSHVALTRLKIAAVKHLPDYESFFLFFGHADDKRNIENYDKYIAPHLDAFSKAYWEGWSLFRGRRINYFKKNLYHFGLMGRTIRFAHIMTRFYGQDPRDMLKAKTLKEQKKIFECTIAPFFNKKSMKFLCNLPTSLYGLGIPPSQFDDLFASSNGDMAQLLKSRLERLGCGSPIKDNYFAWQAFGKGYDCENKIAIPRYLTEENYEKIKKVADHVEVHQTSITEFLKSQPVESFDNYAFLDAQDWMNAVKLNELWSEVLRTAQPGARVIFRTVGAESPLTTKLSAKLLKKWHYDPKASAKAVAKDRSSYYSGFHVYTLGGSG